MVWTGNSLQFSHNFLFDSGHGLGEYFMKKILVPTDFSSCSSDALEVAKKLARHSGAELFLLHLERVMNVVHAVGSPEDEQIRDSRNQLFRLADETERSGMHAHTIFVEDLGLESIEDYVEPYGIDFIVMGSHGQSGIRQEIIGSNTRRLVRKVKVPVLVVKSLTDQNFKSSKILFASTFRQDNIHQLSSLLDFAKTFTASVHFLFLNMYYHLIHEEQVNKIMDEKLKPFEKIQTSRSIAETNDEFLGITEFINKVPVDVVAVEMEHIGVPARWINPPLAERMIQNLDRPVLILPAS